MISERDLDLFSKNSTTLERDGASRNTMKIYKNKQKKKKSKQLFSKNKEEEDFENAIKVAKEVLPKIEIYDSDEEFFYNERDTHIIDGNNYMNSRGSENSDTKVLN